MLVGSRPLFAAQQVYLPFHLFPGFRGNQLEELPADQLLPRPAEKPAVSLVDEGQRRVGKIAADEFRLALHHGAIALLASLKRLLRSVAFGHVDDHDASLSAAHSFTPSSNTCNAVRPRSGTHLRAPPSTVPYVRRRSPYFPGIAAAAPRGTHAHSAPSREVDAGCRRQWWNSRGRSPDNARIFEAIGSERTDPLPCRDGRYAPCADGMPSYRT